MVMLFYHVFQVSFVPHAPAHHLFPEKPIVFTCACLAPSFNLCKPMSPFAPVKLKVFARLRVLVNCVSPPDFYQGVD